jgi:branched-chain amino acid transport system substrate-binding protein
MAPLTGIFAQSGKDMLDGLKLALEQLGYQAAGRKIELIEEDDEGNPAKALAKFRKMVAQDRIHVLNGVLLSNIGYSLVQPIETEKLPALYLTTPDDLTKRKPPKYIMRSNFAGSQNMHPLGEYAAKVLKYKRVATIAMDNPFGHEQIGGFHRVFEDNGGVVVQKIWVPLTTMDFAPYLTQLRRDVDAVASVFVAAQSIRFMKQYADAGLKGRLPILASGVQMDEHALRAMGDEALGAVSALHWSPVLDNSANKKFL